MEGVGIPCLLLVQNSSCLCNFLIHDRMFHCDQGLEFLGLHMFLSSTWVAIFQVDNH